MIYLAQADFFNLRRRCSTCFVTSSSSSVVEPVCERNFARLCHWRPRAIWRSSGKSMSVQVSESAAVQGGDHVEGAARIR